jgi:L-malate glycosyltransferase
LPIRISFLLDQLAQGGAEKHTVMMANALDRTRFAVGMAYLKSRHALLPLVQRDQLEYLDCLDVRFWLDLPVAYRYGAARKRDGTQVVVATNPYSTVYAVAARRLSRATYSIISTYHTTLLHTWQEKVLMPIFRHAMQSSEVLVYMSNYQRDRWRQRGLNPVRDLTIYNGVETDHYSPTVPVSSATVPGDWHMGSDYVVGICAGLRSEKSHLDLVRAVARLAAQGVAIRCLLIGDGPERKSIEQEAAALGVQGRIFITGFQEDVRPYMRLCDVMVLASSTETFSLSALESMAMGKPMVMSDVGGAREQIGENATGLLFPHGDVDALAACLTRLIEKDAHLALGEKAMRNVRVQFSAARMMQQYEKLFEKVAEDRSRRSAAIPTAPV